MNRQRKYILIAAAAGILAMFLPWVRISFWEVSTSTNGMHHNGLVVFFCFIIAGVVAYSGEQAKNPGKISLLIVSACGALASAIMAWNLIDAKRGGGLTFLSYGFYLAALAAVAVLLSAYFFRNSTNK